MSFKKNHSRNNLRIISKKLKVLNFCLSMFIILFGMTYVTGINDLIVKGFDLQELKKESMVLANESRELELKVMSLGSYNSISDKIEELNMVAVQDVQYITVVSDVVARR